MLFYRNDSSKFWKSGGDSYLNSKNVDVGVNSDNNWLGQRGNRFVDIKGNEGSQVITILRRM